MAFLQPLRCLLVPPTVGEFLELLPKYRYWEFIGWLAKVFLYVYILFNMSI